jgi:alpha-ketoglutarate-dependent taurine dioxygenase
MQPTVRQPESEKGRSMHGQVATPHGSNSAYRAITVKRCSPRIGAEIGNIDLTQPLSELELSELKRAFTENLVIFFRNQKISFQDQARLAEYFGPVGQHVGKKTHSKESEDPRVRKFHFDENSAEISGNAWHTDQSCAAVPPLGSILYIHTVPPDGGGDTMFVSMYAAYEALSDRMKHYLEGLTALHDGVMLFGDGTPRTEHPVVVRHPESGRKGLYINASVVRWLNGVPRGEGTAIARFLFEHCRQPEFSFRFRWEPHSIAFWDNRCCHHYATADYWPHVRSGYRVQIEGVAPPAAA